MRGTTGCKSMNLAGQVVSFEQDGEAVLAVRLSRPGQPEGVDQGRRSDGRAAAVQEAPVDSDVVAHKVFPVYPVGKFGFDGFDRGSCTESCVSKAG